ncbi:hypothetical protein C8Q76DRAFT_798256 [Earliella scabrosa]|nr:hypothetical protein C8Q76DRAFT_798256 [Earliella scabrosa]
MSTDFKEQKIIDAYHILVIENYCVIATTTLLWFDFGLTFTTEVRRIWRRKFSGATLVYLLMRYTAFIERVFYTLEVLIWNSSDQTCGGITHTDDVLIILNYLGFAAFTTLHVYGVWGRDSKLFLIVPLTLVRPILYSIEAASYVPGQAGPPLGCVYYMTISDKSLAHCRFYTTSRAATVASDTTLLVLIWIKTYGIHKDSVRLGIRTPLATLLLRDGTAYSIVLLLFQILMIVSGQIGEPSIVFFVWPYFDQVLRAIMLTRFMLDLRGVSFSDPNGTHTTGGFSDIRYTTSLVFGPLGAPCSQPPGFETDSLYSPSSPTRGDAEADWEEARRRQEAQEQGQQEVVGGQEAGARPGAGHAEVARDRAEAQSAGAGAALGGGGVASPVNLTSLVLLVNTLAAFPQGVLPTLPPDRLEMFVSALALTTVLAATVGSVSCSNVPVRVTRLLPRQDVDVNPGELLNGSIPEQCRSDCRELSNYQAMDCRMQPSCLCTDDLHEGIAECFECVTDAESPAEAFKEMQQASLTAYEQQCGALGVTFEPITLAGGARALVTSSTAIVGAVCVAMAALYAL